MDAIVCKFSSIVADLFAPALSHENKSINVESINFEEIVPIKSNTLDDYSFYYTPDTALELGMDIARVIPVVDSNVRKDPLELIRNFHHKFKHLLNETDIMIDNDDDEILRISDRNPNTDDRLLEMIKQGPGSLLLEPYLISDNAARHQNISPKCNEIILQINLNEMLNYDVRNGFMKYGGCLYIDTNDNMQIEYSGNIYTQLSPEWNRIKFIFKSSLIVYLVIKYHASYYHLIYGSLIPTVLLGMPPSYEIRRLMLPFIYNNLQAAEKAHTVLYGGGKYFHRLFAFTESALNNFVKHIFNEFEHRGFTSHYSKFSKYFPSLTDKYPYFEDGLDLYNIFKTFIDKYMKQYISSDEIKEFCDSLNLLSKNKFNIESNEISSFLADFLIIGTLNHGLIGNDIFKWAYDPREISTKLRISNRLEDLYPDEETYYQIITIAGATTMNKVPRLLQDISYYYSSLNGQQAQLVVFREDSEDISRVTIYRKLLSELRALSESLNIRNVDRSIPFHAADPKYLETTLSQ